MKRPRRLTPINLAWTRSQLPKRALNAHKAQSGRCLVVAGSEGMWGAGVLCAKAAARAGAGYVIWSTHFSPQLCWDYPDFLIVKRELSSLKKAKMSALVIGPGLGVTQLSKFLLQAALARAREGIPTVFDADALTLLATLRNTRVPPHCILTPHSGELARLLDIPVEKVNAERRKCAQAAQLKFGGCVLLKGHDTLVIGDEKDFVIKAGNPALAKAGTGDVLSGILGAFLAQGLAVERAACLGAFVHGFLADEWRRKGRDELSLMASDLVDALPEGLARLRIKGRSKT